MGGEVGALRPSFPLGVAGEGLLLALVLVVVV